MKNKKEWLLILIITSASLSLFVKTGDWWTDLFVNKNIKIVIEKHKGRIFNLNTKKNIQFKETKYVNNILFPKSKILFHKLLGSLGYTQDFFMSAEAKFKVKEMMPTDFYIASDDGFRLSVDNKLVCEQINNRPLQITECSIILQQGMHYLKIEYYQGFGDLGLIAKYKAQMDIEESLLGDNSDNIDFVAWKK